MRFTVSSLQSRDVEPPSLGPALQTELRELDPFGALEQVPAEGRVVEQMANKQFPFDLERVVVNLVRGNLLPGVKKIDRLRHIGIPDRLRGIGPRLCPAIGQPCDRRAERSIDVEGRQVIATYARRPGAVDLRDDRPLRAGKFEGRVCGIVGSRPVLATVLVPALRNVRRAETGDTLDFAPEIVEHVAPVTEHVDDYSPIVLLAIIPRRSLRGL